MTPEGRRLISSTVNMFRINKMTKEEVVAHCGLVWVTTAFDPVTPRYFRRLDTPPTDTNELEKARNNRWLNHAMLGAKVWYSLSSQFHIDILGNRGEFERGEEYNPSSRILSNKG